jgi:hypothetical protein
LYKLTDEDPAWIPDHSTLLWNKVF